MRSWSKWLIFSRSTKSSSTVGPRSPALSEFWLSATSTPWLVVNACPVESTRAPSSESVVALRPGTAPPAPTLADSATSLSVLAPSASTGGLTDSPSTGAWPASSPWSCCFSTFAGIAAATACVAAALAARAPIDGPLPAIAGSAPMPDAGPPIVLAAEPRTDDVGAAVFFELAMKFPDE